MEEWRKVNKRTAAKLQELRGPWGKDDKMSDRGGSREQRAGGRRQLWRSLASMQAQEGTPSSTYTVSRPRCRWGAHWAKKEGEQPPTRVQPPLCWPLTTLRLSLCWSFPVYYFCVSRQRHRCHMVIVCQVRLLPGWCEEPSADGSCHFLVRTCTLVSSDWRCSIGPASLLEQASMF